ncbi:bifunctional 5,10-methylene-tetrahydrofolate dehydrogenase/5,10-methylene-tetrahydrofolate cyclohydrolase (plasmid) [Rhodococcus qingshengii]|uniref:bifunctional 5,10-methylenetetrahydrofolate dehydrogenase/5,10-methenyltetrahydrofolate cyclohydrolase n=1 Tax=Rhodococcus TaxID=1827 RepID=UPI0009779779|nr:MULTISPECIES: tetrahydrofolate dehydrogenase/cyclohydrolase catalytic domain-containing protein [Rhodococcus]AUS35708.1 bifunctional 5,10-methylene-tetrahydrofolate dehydrogenase/5,10-methylene-tetrahydrofolate cyclohydrolase [Rhodococcus qingshengii]MCC4306204.1 bifunctional 5,10-methylene-tetrahydrofolate dehydrogenase/5,10-methylene-tetrahydrofolate cyclohydrolase [Rhodococcus sp. 3-2]MCC4306695.1 bifunctional 5,10-methylene-tetrahydrofolate dehydrogenase/5,10-methylene-tetrahydrofolate cy
MAAQLLDGIDLAAQTLSRVTVGVAEFARSTGRRPCLATVLVGDDPASHVYVRMKVNRSQKVGIESRRIDLPNATTTIGLVAVLKALSADPTVDGILLQHPVPAHVDERAAFEAIDPIKDVDGVTRTSFAQMAFGEPGFSSATPGGIMRLLEAFHVQVAGASAVVIGRSPILGKPVGMLLMAADATVTFCHSRTRDVAVAVKGADIVIAAVGRPEFVRGEWIKAGAVVVDAGYNQGNVGDVEFDAARERASLITPVPGGVGPMTIAVLLDQTLTAARNRTKAA